jgi:hypothetical protein
LGRERFNSPYPRADKLLGDEREARGATAHDDDVVQYRILGTVFWSHDLYHAQARAALIVT